MTGFFAEVDSLTATWLSHVSGKQFRFRNGVELEKDFLGYFGDFTGGCSVTQLAKLGPIDLRSEYG
jgi:hypothetical protein